MTPVTGGTKTQGSGKVSQPPTTLIASNSVARRLAASLSPIASITSGVGPTQMMPASVTLRAVMFVRIAMY